MAFLAGTMQQRPRHIAGPSMVLAGPQRAPCLGRPSHLDKDFRLARVKDNPIDSVEKIGGNSKWNYPMTGGSQTAFTAKSGP